MNDFKCLSRFAMLFAFNLLGFCDVVTGKSSSGKVPFVMASHNSTIYILQNIKGSEKYSAWRDDPTFRSSIARVFSEGE